MKLTITTLLLGIAATLSAQSNTEIHLFDLLSQGEKITVVNGKNISNSEGYDSQPYFLTKDVLIYAGTRNGNTEIIQYTKGKERQFNAVTEGGEYSPQMISGGRTVSAVRLDPNGYQRLYSYNPRSAVSKEIVKDAVVAYYTWANETTLVAADIVEDDLHLVIHNIESGKNTDLEISVGRSFHKIPNTNLISFIDKTEDNWVVKSINPQTLEIKEIAPLIPGVEDIAWLPNGSLLASKENTIFIKNKDKQWTSLHSFEDDNLKNLSRIAVSPDGSQLAVVSEISPGTVVDKHIKPFNDRDLEAFSSAFAENVVVRNFFSDTILVGRDRLRASYERYFKQSPLTQVKVVNRIIHNTRVVDEEQVTINDKVMRQATIYEVRNGKIASMTFIKDFKSDQNPVPVVEAQLTTYNNGDIDGFMSLYTEDIALFEYPTTPTMTTREKIASTYSGMFKQVPDLEAIINNRIVIGNITIDHEKLQANGNTWYGLVINEVNKGKINRVTFL